MLDKTGFSWSGSLLSSLADILYPYKPLLSLADGVHQCCAYVDIFGKH